MKAEFLVRFQTNETLLSGVKKLLGVFSPGYSGIRFQVQKMGKYTCSM